MRKTATLLLCHLTCFTICFSSSFNLLFLFYLSFLCTTFCVVYGCCVVSALSVLIQKVQFLCKILAQSRTRRQWKKRQKINIHTRPSIPNDKLRTFFVVIFIRTAGRITAWFSHLAFAIYFQQKTKNGILVCQVFFFIIIIISLFCF